MAQFDLANATIYIKDGGVNSLIVKVGEGNLKYDESREVEIVQSRGVIDTARLGNQKPMAVTLAFVWEFLRAEEGDPPSIEDAIKQRGEASDWVSTNSDPDAPYCVDIEIVYEPVCSDAPDEYILLPQFNYTDLGHSAKDATVDIQGECLAVEATVTRVE